MKLYGIVADKYNLRCRPDLVPVMFTDLKKAEGFCDDGEEVVELLISVKERLQRKEKEE